MTIRTPGAALAALAAMSLAAGSLAAGSLAAASSAVESPTPAAAPPTGAGPVEFAADDPAFYDVPDPIPTGEHGQLLRFQRIGVDFDHRYRIMYQSQGVSGAPTVVTGLVDVGDDAPPFGGFPLLLHAHGSLGIADACSPSRAFVGSTTDGSYASEFESVGQVATTAGWVVVSTDYEGLGGPGSHPFLVGVSEGRSVLDAGRAARQIPGLYIGDHTAIAGFSQGGHAGLWAAQLAPDWTPEQPIVGTVLGAAASEVGALASWASSQPELSALTVGIVAGLATTYPEAAAALGDVLTATGLELVSFWDEHCFDENLGTPGQFVSADPATVEPFASLLAANTAGMTANPSPLLLFHAEADERIPFAHSDALLERLCDAGQVVERRVLPDGLHTSSLVAVENEGIVWLDGLLDGTTTPSSSCSG